MNIIKQRAESNKWHDEVYVLMSEVLGFDVRKLMMHPFGVWYNECLDPTAAALKGLAAIGIDIEIMPEDAYSVWRGEVLLAMRHKLNDLCKYHGRPLPAELIREELIKHLFELGLSAEEAAEKRVTDYLENKLRKWKERVHKLLNQYLDMRFYPNTPVPELVFPSEDIYQAYHDTGRPAETVALSILIGIPADRLAEEIIEYAFEK